MLGAAPYRDHQEILRTLNDIGNAHKHTHIDAGPDTAGAREPVIFALALRRNGLTFGPTFFRVPLRSLVEDFDRFYAGLPGVALPHGRSGICARRRRRLDRSATARSTGAAPGIALFPLAAAA